VGIVKVAKWQQRGVVAAAAALLVAACGGGEEVDVDGEPEAGDGTNAEDGTDDEDMAGGVLVAGIAGEPDQLDPHITTAYASFQVLENVYDTLVAPDVNGEFQPSLAT
jgi:peptide/nickel transport system substrate-binding protein